MDTSEKEQNQEWAEKADRKYQLTFQRRAGKKNRELQARITKPSESNKKI
jgi:hypothetical protein